MPTCWTLKGGSVWLLDAQGSELACLAAISDDRRELAIDLYLKADQGLVGVAARSGQSVLASDATHDPRFFPGVDALTGVTTRSLIAVPLRARDTVIGVLEVINRRHGTFGEYDVLLVETLAATAAIAIENARWYESSQIEIRERRMAEQALAESQHFVQRIVDGTPNLVYIYDLAELRFLYANRNASSFFGFTPQQLAELGSQAFQAIVHADDRAALETHRRSCANARDDQALSIEYRIRNPRGEWDWLRSTEVVFARSEQGRPTQILGIAQNITERKHSEESLKASEAKFRTLVENLPDGIVLVGDQGKVVEWNPAQEELTRVSRSTALGQPIWDAFTAMVGPEIRASGAPDRFRQSVLELLSTGHSAELSQDRELTLIEPGGRRRVLRMTSSPIATPRGFMMSTITHDITRRIQVQLALEQAKEAAEAANQSKSQFLARMSHEIRTPLHGITGLTALLANTELTLEQNEYLQMIKSSADLLLGVVNDILDFSKIEAGHLELERTEFDLRHVIDDTSQAVAIRAHAKGLELVVQIAPDLATAVVGDPVRIGQILINLLGNAVKFTQQGEIVLTVEQGDAPATAGGCSYRFAVSDSGIGISAEKQRVIFDAFRQGDGSTTREYGGTGLGLSISHELVELMGGHLSVTSEPGRGSRFEFCLALERAPHAQAPQWLAPEIDLAHAAALVVDDNERNRHVLCDLLSGWGLTVTQAATALAGLQELEQSLAGGPRFSLILLDATMPKMDGFVVSNWYREDPATRDTIVMMLTADNAHASAARCREMGIAHHLIKPIQPAALAEIIAQMHLGHGRPPALSPDAGAAPPESTPSQPDRLRILLAEDNAVNQLVAGRLLSQMGHHVEFAGNGIEALKKLQERQFDLVLMDVEMPLMDGLTAAREIRRRESQTGDHVPILAMTAYASNATRDQCRDAGMDSYLRKPFSPEQLATALKPFARSTAVHDIPVCDLDTGLAAVGGSVELLHEAVAVFLDKDYPRHLASIETGLVHQDAGQVQRAAHGLQGALGTFGALAACDLARKIETEAKENHLQDAGKRLAEFKVSVDAFAALFH